MEEQEDEIDAQSPAGRRFCLIVHIASDVFDNTEKKTKTRKVVAEDQDGEMENSNIRYVPNQRRGNAFAFSKDELAIMTPSDLDSYAQEVRKKQKKMRCLFSSTKSRSPPIMC